jgi:hypothetical protein
MGFQLRVTKRPGQLPQAVYFDCWVFILRPSIFLAGTGMAALGTFRIWLLLLTTSVFEGKADIGITSAQVGTLNGHQRHPQAHPFHSTRNSMMITPETSLFGGPWRAWQGPAAGETALDFSNLKGANREHISAFRRLLAPRAELAG